MGRLASGQVMSLMFIIPGLWLLSLTVSTPDFSVLLYYLILCLVALLNLSVETFAVVAAVLALAVGSLPSPILLADNSCSLLFFRLIMIIYSLILYTKLFQNSPETDVSTDPTYANFVSSEHA